MKEASLEEPSMYSATAAICRNIHPILRNAESMFGALKDVNTDVMGFSMHRAAWYTEQARMFLDKAYNEFCEGYIEEGRMAPLPPLSKSGVPYLKPVPKQPEVSA